MMVNDDGSLYRPIACSRSGSISCRLLEQSDPFDWAMMRDPGANSFDAALVADYQKKNSPSTLNTSFTNSITNGRSSNRRRLDPPLLPPSDATTVSHRNDNPSTKFRTSLWCVCIFYLPLDIPHTHIHTQYSTETLLSV